MKIIQSTFLAVIVFLIPGTSTFADQKSDQSAMFWAQEVIKGGYILHFRHGNRNRYTITSRTPETDVTAFDSVALRLGLSGEDEDFGIVTCLTAEGKAEAKLVGRAFKILDVKVGAVLSSPSCRARQTSYHAFGTEGKIVNSLLHRTSVMQVQHEDFSRDLREKIMSINIEPGENAILSGHVGTLNYEEKILFDKNEVGSMSRRDDIGFVIIERTEDDKLIARYMFDHFKKFTVQVMELPLN
jgi:hypothetical protein